MHHVAIEVWPSLLLKPWSCEKIRERCPVNRFARLTTRSVVPWGSNISNISNTCEAFGGRQLRAHSTGGWDCSAGKQGPATKPPCHHGRLQGKNVRMRDTGVFYFAQSSHVEPCRAAWHAQHVMWPHVSGEDLNVLLLVARALKPTDTIQKLPFVCLLKQIKENLGDSMIQ